MRYHHYLKQLLLLTFFVLTGGYARATSTACNGLHVDGGSQRVTVPSSATIPVGTASRTWECWVFPTASDNRYMLGNGTDVGGQGHAFMIYLNGANHLAFWGHFVDLEFTGGTYTLNQWNHIAVSYDGTTLTGYINGASVGDFTTSLNTSATDFWISPTTGNGKSFQGIIDEVRVWNTVRTASEISTHMNTELAGTESGLVAYYQFGEGAACGTNTGTTMLHDLTANANNGTLENFGLTCCTSNWVPGYAFSGSACTVTTAQEIDVQGNNVSIMDGDITPDGADKTDFGTATVTGVTNTYTIFNSGSVPLNITNITSSNTTEFAVSGVPSSVAANSSETFTVTFTPSVAGLYTSTIHIASDDCDEADYDFAIQGTGDNTMPALTNASSSATICHDITPGMDLSALATATDPDPGQTLTWTVITPPAHGTLSGFPATLTAPVTGASPTGLYYTPTPGYGGSDQFLIAVSDGTASSQQAFLINVLGPIDNNTIVSGAQTLCNGTAATTIDGSAATGGDGTISYLWESSTTDASNGFGAAAGTNNTEDYSPGTLSQITWFRRQATAGGGCGNSSNTTTAVEVTVNTAPSFTTCTGNQTGNTDAGSCDGAVTYSTAPVATGSPAPALTYAFTGATTGSGSGDGSGSTFSKGVTNVTLTADNGCGSPATCTFTVTVFDMTPPTVTCEPNVTINTTPGLCTGTTSLTQPTTSDNCSGTITVTSDAPSTYQIGTTTVTWTATDESSNQATCTQTVTVVAHDATAPTINASATSNCGTVATTLSIASGSLNDASDWQWYSGTCGGTSIGSGTSITVSPAVTTTYYARGEGSCVTPGSCGSIQIAVNAVPTVATITAGVTNVDYLVVAGGGGGSGDAAGGGGGGGVLTATNYSVAGMANINVTVGAGGVANNASNSIAATNGGNSVFGTVTAIGGGRGGRYSNNPGISGGSGGGGAYPGAAGGAGTAGQGNAGGIGNGGNPGAGGGGGGAGGAGGNGASGGVGGIGIASAIGGSTSYYGGGGGGGRFGVGGEGINNVNLGGGGRGAGSCSSNPAIAGTANTGGGGGGAPAGCQQGGAAGGSGIIIIRYPGTPAATGGTITQAGGYTIHTFTNIGTTTFTNGGGTTVCVGTTTTYSDATPGGVWSSSDNNIATVSTTGVVTGVAAGSANIIYTVTTNGCSASTSLPVTVNTAPVITCPSTQTVTTASGSCNSTVTYAPVVTGTPAPTISYSFSGATTGSGSGSGSGSSFNIGTTTVTLTAINACSTVSCSFSVVVNAPEINVQGNGNNIADGSTSLTLISGASGTGTDFGSTVFTRTFTLQNTGNAALSVTPALSITGANASDFTVTASPASSVTGGGSTTFTIAFNPSATGTRNATVHITNNDCDESDYDFAIQGTGVQGTALNFDGTDDYVISTSNIGITGSSPRTLEYYGVLSDAYHHQANWGGTNTQSATFGTYTNGSGSFLFYGFGAGDFATGFVPDGNLHHVAVTYDGTYARVYVDGTLTPAGAVAKSLNTADGRLVIGVREDMNASFSAGNMDEVRVWNRALCQSEIQNNINHTLPAPTSQNGLVLYWRMDQGVASGNNTATGTNITMLTDASNSGNNGILNNFDLTGSTSNFVTSTVATTVAAAYTQPEIDLQGGSPLVSIADGTTATTTTNFTDFGNGPATRTFTIRNTGTASLTMGAITFAGVNNTDFTVTTPPSATVAAAGTTTFVVTFNPSATGVRTATIHIASSDCDEADYDFALQGTGTSGKALVFDGTDDYVSVPNNTNMNTSTYTVMGWVYPTATGGVYRCLWARRTSTLGWNMYINSSGRWDFWNGYSSVIAGPSVCTNQWTHIAVTGDANGQRLYVNGSLIGTTSAVVNPATGQNLTFGVVNDQILYPFAGKMDDIRFYNTSKTAAQIQAEYTCELSSPYNADLLYYFKLNQNVADGDNTSAGTTVTNELANGNGTLVNFARTGTASNWTSGNLNPCSSAALAEIEVTGNSNQIIDGTTTTSTTTNTDFGTGLNITRTFTISNVGNTPITLASNAFTISGSNAADFSVSNITLPASIAGNSSATFDVTFAPAGTGSTAHTATVHIANNDCDEFDFDFAVSGIPCQPAAFTTCPANKVAYSTQGTCNPPVTYTTAASGIPAPIITYQLTGATVATGSGDGSGSNFNVGITTVKVTATNNCAAPVCTFTVTVLDTIKPIITCANNVAVNNDNNSCGAVVNYAISATDNCTTTLARRLAIPAVFRPIPSQRVLHVSV